MNLAAIRAQPLRPSPSEGPSEAKGGRLPDRLGDAFGASAPLLGGVRRGLTKGRDQHHADQQGFQARRSRSYAQDRRIVHRRPRSAAPRNTGASHQANAQTSNRASDAAAIDRSAGAIRRRRRNERRGREGGYGVHLGTLGEFTR